MRTLNQLQWLRMLLIRIKRLYLTRFWGMDIEPTALFSLSVRFDMTNPTGIHVGGGTYIAFDAVILSHDASRDLWADTWIGKSCFVGARSIILPGVRIGDCCVIGSGSVVTSDVPSRCIVGGNPARIISRGIEVGTYGIKRQDQEQTSRQIHDHTL
jgi:acetyltransferase-like isoleucine patch superfamily enzyme